MGFFYCLFNDELQFLYTNFPISNIGQLFKVLENGIITDEIIPFYLEIFMLRYHSEGYQLYICF